MARRDPEGGRNAFEAALLQRAVFDQSDRGVCETLRAVDGGIAGRQLGTTAEAGTEAFMLCRRGAREKPAMLRARRAHRAHRTTINAGGRDAHVKPTVETTIVCR